VQAALLVMDEDAT